MKATVYAKEKEPWKLNAAEGNIDLFFMLLKNLRGKKPSDFLRSLYSIGKYKKYLEDYADFRNMEVRDLSSIWKEYQHDASTYNDWVEWGKYIVKYNKELKETLKNKDGIMLSTMHGSKGLEWKHVFIIDCVEGVCPSPKAETAEELEEERRLCYVGITRAMKDLTLTCAQQRMIRGETQYNKVSRFVREIPRELVDLGHTIQEKKPKAEDLIPTPTKYSKMKEILQSRNYKPREFKVTKSGSLDYEVGDTVRHIKFGVGIVKEIVEGGRDYEVTVEFDKVGVKKMFASFAKLKKI